jgi:nucleotide-binding universal stress UspA family protein
VSYRNILVQADESAQSVSRVNAAAGVAARFGATLTGMFLRSDYVPAFVVGDAFTAVTTLEAYVEERDQKTAVASAAARDIFRTAAENAGIDADWIEVNGDEDQTILAAVRRFDLTVFPQLATSSFGTHAVNVATVGLGSGTPVLIVPERGAPMAIGRKILVGWKESRESTRALRDALPFLTAADEVHLLTVSADARTDFDDLLRRNLTAHGCRNIQIHVDRNTDLSVANSIQRHAGMVGADMVVLGLYGHSRVRELFLGGVSRDMLGDLQLPMLLSH